jgi:hypothetical protein
VADADHRDAFAVGWVCGRAAGRRSAAPIIVMLSLSAGCADAPLAGDQPARYLQSERPVPGRYIVALADTSRAARRVARSDDDLVPRYGGAVLHAYRHAFAGYAAELTREQALALAMDPDVAFVEEDGWVETSGVESTALWGLLAN